jgi:hypothetical protein
MGRRIGWPGLLLRAQLSCVLVLSSGCTIVQVNGAAAVTSLHFGILQITPAPDTAATVVDIRGLGLVPTSDGVTLGGSREQAVYIPKSSDCRALFFIEDEVQADAIIAKLKAQHFESKSICSTGDIKP